MELELDENSSPTHPTINGTDHHDLRTECITALSITLIDSSSFCFSAQKERRRTATLSGLLGHPADLNDLSVLPSVDRLEVVARPGPRSAVHLRLTEVSGEVDVDVVIGRTDGSLMGFMWSVGGGIWLGSTQSSIQCGRIDEAPFRLLILHA